MEQALALLMSFGLLMVFLRWSAMEEIRKFGTEMGRPRKRAGIRQEHSSPRLHGTSSPVIPRILGDSGAGAGSNSSFVLSRPLWMDHGWRFTPAGYVGKYRTPYGSWNGLAYYDRQMGELHFIIFQPPQAALTGGHSPCFRKTEEPGAYWVHLNTPPADVFAGIQGIQKTLIESFARR